MTLDVDAESFHSSFFELLVKCPLNLFRKLIHHLIDQFCGQNETSLYNSYSDVYSLFDWWNITDQSNKFLKEYYSLDNQNTEIPEKWGSLPSQYTSILKDVVEVRYSDLKEELIERTHRVSPAYLKSFDWRLKMTLASDKMSQINEPRLLLDLDIAGIKEKFLQLDLSKEELKTLIDTMEEAKPTVVNFVQHE